MSEETCTCVRDNATLRMCKACIARLQRPRKLATLGELAGKPLRAGDAVKLRAVGGFVETSERHIGLGSNR